jgi:hypothetical protein
MRFHRAWWRPRNLLLAWCAYWVTLVVVGLGPAIAVGWRLSHDPESHGNAAIKFGNGIVNATISEPGRSSWGGSISVLTLALLVAIPPLLLWLVWLVGTSRTNNAGRDAANADPQQRELYATDSRTQTFESSTSRRRAREES